MAPFCLAVLLYASARVALAHVLPRQAGVAFSNPTHGGGSWLDNSGNGLGEPLNVVISGLSSPAVLTNVGFTNFVRALGLSTECLGIHLGDPQSANLGDGNGPVNQTMELREDFGFTILGTCLESALGGNHLRVFRQNGPTANTGALFLAVSKEKSILEHHGIVPDGYDAGRDKLVASALRMTSFEGVTYSTTAQNFTGFLQPGSTGINHGISTDGVVKLLTVVIQ